MIVGFCSDLHLDHGYHRLLTEDKQLNEDVFLPADVLILAGDIIEVKDIFRSDVSSMRWKTDEFRHFLGLLVKKYNKVLYVYGNHEFYNSSIEKCINRASILELEFSNLHILNNNHITIGDITFFGSTLWSDLSNPMSEYEARSRMNDYRRITHMNRTIRPSDTTRFHFESLKSINSFMNTASSEKTVIVTHHAPSRQSLDPKFRESTLNDAYMSDLDKFIYDHQPAVWIHGHLHCINDYYIGSTRILSNPRGYQLYEPGLCHNFQIKTFNI